MQGAQTKSISLPIDWIWLWAWTHDQMGKIIFQRHGLMVSKKSNFIDDYQCGYMLGPWLQYSGEIKHQKEQRY